MMAFFPLISAGVLIPWALFYQSEQPSFSRELMSPELCEQFLIYILLPCKGQPIENEVYKSFSQHYWVAKPH